MTGASKYFRRTVIVDIFGDFLTLTLSLACDLDLQSCKQCHEWILHTEKPIKLGITHVAVTSMLKIVFSTWLPAAILDLSP